MTYIEKRFPIIKGKKVIVWGTGNAYLKYHLLFKDILNYYVDSDSLKWGNIIDGKIIMNPKMLEKEKKGSFCVFVLSEFCNDILQTLKQMNIQSDSVITYEEVRNVCNNEDVKRHLSDIYYDRRPKKWLYLPVEVKVRELWAKLLLACTAAVEGINVVVARRQEIQNVMLYFPNGLVIEKDISLPSRLEEINYYKNVGNKVVTWDEEGVNFWSNDIYGTTRINTDVIDKIEAFISWGDMHKRALEKKISGRVKILNLGNPRLDLLNSNFRKVFMKEVELLIEQYGHYILVISPGGVSNNFQGLSEFVSGLKDYGYTNFFIEEFIKYSEINIKKYQQLIKEIRESFPNKKIIIRPHPAENHNDGWFNIFNDDSMVEIIHNGNIVPWILASHCMIHTVSTTGNEALLLGKPSISYNPGGIDYDFQLRITEDLSINAKSINEVVSIISQYDEIASKQTKELQQKLYKYFAGIDKNITYSKNIIYSLDEFFEYDYEINSILIEDINKINFNKNKKYVEHKFPHTDVEEIAEMVKKLKENDGSFECINVYPLSNQSYLITVNDY